MYRKYEKGFTLIELLVVIAIIALLLSVIVPSLGKAKEYAKRVVCANNVKQLTLGVRLYSEQNEDALPLNTQGVWYWDVSYFTTDYLMNEGGLVQDSFYCPSDRYKNIAENREKYWRLSEVATSGGTLPAEEPTGIDDRKANFRVTSYFYLTAMQKRRDGTTPSRLFNPTTGPELPAKMTDIKNTGAQLLFVDAIISGRDTADNETFTEITGGWSDTFVGVPDSSCHVGRDGKPTGANVGYADGHAGWKRFEDMVERNTNNPKHHW